VGPRSGNDQKARAKILRTTANRKKEDEKEKEKGAAKKLSAKQMTGEGREKPSQRYHATNRRAKKAAEKRGGKVKKKKREKGLGWAVLTNCEVGP